MSEIGPTRRRVVDALKRRALTGPELAQALGVTHQAVRPHLGALADAGLVEGRERSERRGPGRPPTEWVLTELARDLFPDRHADLTVELIGSIRDSLGPEALDRLVSARNERLIESYVEVVSRAPDPVQALADRRSAEGYMAEVIDEPDGSRLLVEHHCPICDAAQACQSLCQGELELFESVLGPDLDVTREQHLLSGDQRCTYRITPT